VLPIPIACIAWTVTHEEIFREPREYCVDRSLHGKTLWERKFFYLFTCEYCFSHYVALLALWLTGYTLLLEDWRGYVIAGFALIWVANVYMSLFAYLRGGMQKEKIEIKAIESALESTLESTSESPLRSASESPQSSVPFVLPHYAENGYSASLDRRTIWDA
jgi:hypothetical protein